MAHKRPCRICGSWFRPNPRAGDRQKVCSRADCQRERCRRAVADWRRRNPDYDREDRLRRRLRGEVSGREGPEGRDGAGRGRIDLVAARNAVGLEVAVFVEEYGEVLTDLARNAVAPKDPGK